MTDSNREMITVAVDDLKETNRRLLLADAELLSCLTGRNELVQKYAGAIAIRTRLLQALKACVEPMEEELVCRLGSFCLQDEDGKWDRSLTALDHLLYLEELETPLKAAKELIAEIETMIASGVPIGG